jgi:AcrR family transcriptional regulator
MAYQQTVKVKAHIAAQKQLIITCAIDLIKADGLPALTSRRIAERAGISNGLVFKYFPDMPELIAQVEAVIMNRDLEAIDSATKAHEGNPNRALVAGILMLMIRLADRISREMMAERESYRAAMARKLGHLIGPAIERVERFERSDARTLARAALGAIQALALGEDQTQKNVSTVVLFVLGGIGIPAATAQAAMEAVEKV